MEQQIERYAQTTAVAILVVGCFWVLKPFIAAMLFAAVVCSSTWPAFVRLRSGLGGRPAFAALAMTLLLALVIIVPVALLAVSITDNVQTLVEAAKRALEGGAPQPPEWLVSIPFVGEQLDTYWRRVVESREELTALLRRLIDPTKAVLLATGGVLGEGILQLTLATLIGFFFYRDGDALVRVLRASLDKIAGNLAETLLTIVNSTVNSVVYGILGTSLAQAAAAAVGFLVAGVPAAFVLGVATFFLSMIPLGPPLIWGGATVWLLYQDHTAWAVFMALWGFFVISGIDNVVRPYLISRGASLPFILVFLGVLGGVIAFGFIGIFIGPTLLALGYGLLHRWSQVRRGEPVVPPPPAQA
ncbi:MAG: AI-2E family transporter [Betaproteobacteria bacterium]|nr:AI-2E family transporter [Betaproteobacteria bacterium]